MSRKLLLGFAIFAALFFLGAVWFYPWPAFALLFLSHTLILFPTLLANCQWWGPVVRHFQTEEREVWLTLDDGPDETHTAEVLELLERFNAKATFFLIGERALRFPGAIEKIRAAGHEIGNHTFSHPSETFWALGPARIAAEIDRFPIASRLFRAPAGLKNFVLHPLLAARGMRLVGWTVRGLDTVSSDAEAVVARIRRKLRPGTIILLHEGERPFYRQCLKQTLMALTKEGYRCVLPPL